MNICNNFCIRIRIVHIKLVENMERKAYEKKKICCICNGVQYASWADGLCTGNGDAG